jgi:tetratricopeptide (TPR) repeat protein
MAKNKLNNLMRKKSKKSWVLKALLILAVLLAIMVAVYFLPPVHDRLAWRVYNLRMQIFYFFNPPGEESFTPAQQAEMDAIVQQTQTAMALAYTATLAPSQTPTNFVSPTPTPTMTPTPTATPLPESKTLTGVVWEAQGFNNCGPANLAMALSYWGWQGDQYTTGDWLRPNNRDRNVMPYEMVDYVQQETNFDVVLRYGGDIEMLKKFIAAGFPVLIEKGFEDEVPQGGWMGHYGVITAYDDATEIFLIQDSYVKADYAYSYARVEKFWQAFNYVYLVIYPPERESQVLSILGPQADETYNLQQAAQKALEETATMTGKQQFFAWYNYGTNLVNLTDYFGAAQAYDNAYAFLDEEYDGYNPMWRITWYQTGPYYAYYWTGRYDDLIRLADLTISYSSVEPAIEETWIWRARAKVALGDLEGAIEDYREALKWHPGWAIAESELAVLGVTP